MRSLIRAFLRSSRRVDPPPSSNDAARPREGDDEATEVVGASSGAAPTRSDGATGTLWRSASAVDRTTTVEAASDAPVRRFGDYDLLRELGRGGMGIVHLARDRRLDRLVALKVLPSEAGLAVGAAERFRREAEVVSRLEHPGLAQVLDVGETEGLAWIAMPYVRGRTLAEVLGTERTERFPGWRDAVAFVEDLARALEAAHEVGVVHRDLKPGNVMVRDDGRPVILDFGLARDLASGDAGPTLSGDVLGTPAYMAPEQIRGQAHRADARLDVWALGVLLHEILTGERPFRGASREALYRAILESELTPLRRRRRGWPKDLDIVLATLLAKDPNRRYAQVADLADDLRALRLGEPIQARPPGPLRRAAARARRHPLATTWLAMLLVGGPVLTGFGVAHLRDRARLEETVTATTARIVEALEGSDHRRATRLLDRLDALAPDHPRRSRFAARAARARDLERVETLVLDDEIDPQGERALAELRRLVRVHGEDPAFTALRAVVHLRLGEEDAAREHLAAVTEEWNLGPVGDLIAAGSAPTELGPEARARHARLRAFLLSARGRHREAFELLARRIASAPRAAGLAWVAAEQLTRLQDHEGALGYAGRARGLVEGFGPRRRARYAVHLRRAGLLTEALDLAEAAAREAPDDAYVRVHLVNALADAGETARAREAAASLVADAPEFALAWRAKAALEFDAGKLEAAESAYEKALSRAPESREIALGLANTWIESGEPARARDLLEPLLEKRPDFPYGWNTLATAHRDLGDLDAATAAVEKALEMAPDYGAAHGTRGSILHHRGRTRSAEAAYRRALELEPRLVPSLFNLALLLHRKDPDEAIALYRRILAIAPEDVGALINVSNLLSKDEATWEEAARHARRATELAPREVIAWNNLATALADLGRTEEAIPVLREVLARDPRRVEGHANLMMLLADSDPLEAYAHGVLLVVADPRFATRAEGNLRRLASGLAEAGEEHPLVELAAAGLLLGEGAIEEAARRAELEEAVRALPRGEPGGRERALRRAARELLARAHERAGQASRARALRAPDAEDAVGIRAADR